jgi:hypothetical protein
VKNKKILKKVYRKKKKRIGKFKKFFRVDIFCDKRDKLRAVLKTKKPCILMLKEKIQGYKELI